MKPITTKSTFAVWVALLAPVLIAGLLAGHASG